MSARPWSRSRRWTHRNDPKPRRRGASEPDYWDGNSAKYSIRIIAGFVQSLCDKRIFCGAGLIYTWHAPNSLLAGSFQGGYRNCRERDARGTSCAPRNRPPHRSLQYSHHRCTSTIRSSETVSRAHGVPIWGNWRWLALLASPGRDVPTCKGAQGTCRAISPLRSRSPSTPRDSVNDGQAIRLIHY